MLFAIDMEIPYLWFVDRSVHHHFLTLVLALHLIIWIGVLQLSLLNGRGPDGPIQTYFRFASARLDKLSRAWQLPEAAVDKCIFLFGYPNH